MKIKPLLLLVLMVPFLTELLSGNLPPSRFFLPLVFVFLVMVYGAPLLLIRELAVRWKLGIEGVFLLGLAYGIFNEGICAKTLFLTQTVPLKEAFGHYSLTGGVNVPWAWMILPWHAFHSVLYPIIITTFLYPAECKESWLDRYWIVFLSGVVVLLGAFLYFTEGSVKAVPGCFLFMFLLMGLLALSAKYAARTSIEFSLEKNSLWGYVMLGLGIFGYTFVISLLGILKFPQLILLSCIAWLGVIFYGIVKPRQWLSIRGLFLVVLGNYAGDALLLFMGGVMNHSPERVIVGCVFFLLIPIGIALKNKWGHVQITRLF